MSNLTLTIACWGYDKVKPFLTGEVKIEGVEINLKKMWVQEIFRRMLGNKEFDASEMSFSAYISTLFTKDKPFIGIPVFLSRKFRLGYIFINRESGIRKPEDLKGRRVGIPEFRHTASVWIRGILEEKYGVPVESVTYVLGPMEREKSPNKYYIYVPQLDSTKLYRNDIKIVRAPEGKVLSEMLAENEIDALYHAQIPTTYYTTDKVKRLFDNYIEEDLKYFREEGIFPIMHLLVIRRDIYEKNKWIAKALYDAFLKAKEIAYEELRVTGVNTYMHPWLEYEMEKITKLMGQDYWPYGVKANKKAIEKFIYYMYKQGLIPDKLEVEEIFAPETLDT
ncbi:ABC transporter substrate-binding protein [Sulfolobus sp. E11-6]|uniref:ABC transporter substrate-binding protein n=1 Tax=Sulfolobus sp. E11-6 TaxID=2663020 RepID=UPI001297953F|nr:ABC transporter substrate-binding protein [Sulfolobus sp. E11-6]QGA69000.1 ABC transporter substrate-binding protein [Sulfolobus sp. E11-6]